MGVSGEAQGPPPTQTKLPCEGLACEQAELRSASLQMVPAQLQSNGWLPQGLATQLDEVVTLGPDEMLNSRQIWLDAQGAPLGPQELDVQAIGQACPEVAGIQWPHSDGPQHTWLASQTAPPQVVAVPVPVDPPVAVAPPVLKAPPTDVAPPVLDAPPLLEPPALDAPPVLGGPPVFDAPPAVEPPVPPAHGQAPRQVMGTGTQLSPQIASCVCPSVPHTGMYPFFRQLQSVPLLVDVPPLVG
jgi:hypothetical protein